MTYVEVTRVLVQVLRCTEVLTLFNTFFFFFSVRIINVLSTQTIDIHYQLDCLVIP